MIEAQTYLNTAQVAELLGLSIATIRRWVFIGTIPYKKLGKAVRFSAPEIQEWVKSKSIGSLDTKEGENDKNI